MDIVFLIPDINEFEDENKLDNIISSSVEMVPLGVFYLSSLLKEYGYKVEVFDFSTFHSKTDKENCINKIVAQKPKIIGISTSTTSYPTGKILANKLKSTLNEKTIFVWGGYHVTFLPDEVLYEGIADIVVRGEGEFTMIEIAKYYLEKHGNLSQIKGISYKLNGKVIHNSPSILRTTQIDSLPFPDRDLVAPENYRNPGTIISSRGCVAKCQFCAAGAMGSIVMRNPENVVAEIKSLNTKYGFNHLFFVDNTFTTHKNRALTILGKIKDEGVKVKFTIESRVSQVDEEFIKNLASYSLVAVQFGVETGNDSIMKEIGKKITLKQVENVVDLCLNYGIRVMTSFVIGHPGDTKETISDTINFAKKLVRRGAHAIFGILTPFPGTEVFNNREKLGIEILDWDFSRWNLNLPVMKTKHLSRRDLKIYLSTALSEINAIY